MKNADLLSSLKVKLVLFSLLLLALSCSSDESVPEGYSQEKLQLAENWANRNTQTAAVIVMVDGEIIYQWGDIDEKQISHSTRKSFMSALYGKYVENGTIDLNATMGELGIDDEPPLTAQELTATVRHCLESSSGVYHTALAESEAMHDLKPDRDTYLPGEFWIYNNWDFNVLRTIFEQETGINFFQALKTDIMDPIGANFQLTDSISWKSERSMHAAYMMFVSAADMARFGQLMLQKGNWEGNQVIPKNWVEESTQYRWDANIYGFDGYAYMWWVATNENTKSHLPNCRMPSGSYSARGAGGQWLEVIPERNMVFVHMVDTKNGDRVDTGDIGTILQMILNAEN